MNYTILYKPMLIVSFLVSMSLMGACKSEEALDPQVPLTGKVKQMQFFEGTKLVKSESRLYKEYFLSTRGLRLLDAEREIYKNRKRRISNT